MWIVIAGAVVLLGVIAFGERLPREPEIEAMPASFTWCWSADGNPPCSTVTVTQGEGQSIADWAADVREAQAEFPSNCECAVAPPPEPGAATDKSDRDETTPDGASSRDGTIDDLEASDVLVPGG